MFIIAVQDTRAFRILIGEQARAGPAFKQYNANDCVRIRARSAHFQLFC